MITPHPTAFGRWFWQTTGRVGIRLFFREFRIESQPVLEPDKPLLLIGNHISWWDGFWAMEINRRLWKKDFYVMMLEEQLAQRPFMRQTGAFSVQPGTRDALKSLDFAASLLQQPSTLMLIYPQGSIRSQYDRTFSFGSGLQRILKQAPDAQLIAYAALVDYGSHPRPAVSVFMERLSGIQETRALETAYREFFLGSEKQVLEEGQSAE